MNDKIYKTFNETVDNTESEIYELETQDYLKPNGNHNGH